MSLHLFPYLVSTALLSAVDVDSLKITARLFHLGDGQKPEWKDFTSVEPSHGTHLEVDFQAFKNEKKLFLEVQAGEVGEVWRVKINGQELGQLEKAAPLTANYFRVPPGTLKDGRNRLLVSADKVGDDIYVGRAFLHQRPLGEILGYAKVSVLVRDADSGDTLPSRLTITHFVRKKVKEKVKEADKEKEIDVERTVEELVDVLVRNEDDLAARKGILYTRKGLAEFDVAPGEYTVYATRGFEYGVAAARLKLDRFQEREVELEIRREVDTRGYLAADTHIHTRTHSGHGDINMEERVIAIAGEGVEVAVATDHNHLTDYAPVLEKVNPQADIRTVIGNEVTTSVGHFNAFPYQKDAEPTEHDHTQWTRLVQAMRNSSGVRVVILNHPRRNLTKTGPLGQIRLNPVSGEAHDGPEDLGLTAIEILNGKTLTDDRMMTLNDWFGILNRGYRLAAVAASDSHSVAEIVGQARSYVKSATDDPRRIRIDEFCDSFREGRVLASLGLLAQVEVNGRFGVGDLATPLGSTLDVKVTVQAPSWIQADRVVLYLNGFEVKRESIQPTDEAVKYRQTWRLPIPPNDAHLVVVASGPAVTALYWPIAGGDKKYVMGATNPLWIDADGDGKFTCAREYASRLVSAKGVPGEDLQRSLLRYDPAIAVQFASLFRSRVEMEAQAAYERLIDEADQKLADLMAVNDSRLKKRFVDYLAAAPRIDIRTRLWREEERDRLKKEEEDRTKKREERLKKKKEEEEKKRKEEEDKRKKDAEEKKKRERRRVQL